MKRWTKHYKRMRYLRIKFSLLVILVNLIFLPTFVKYSKDEANLFHVFVNGKEVGYAGSINGISDIIADARRDLAHDSQGVIYVNADVTYESSSVTFGEIDSDYRLRENITNILRQDAQEVLRHAYTVKIGDYVVNLAGRDEVLQVLQAALDMYEDDGKYLATLYSDPNRELNALTVMVVTDEEATVTYEDEPVENAGFDLFINNELDAVDEIAEIRSFDDYEYGIMSMSFDDNIEVVDSYLTQGQITGVEKAINDIVAVQEKKTIYEVQEGDTLSEISLKVNIPVDRIIELNESLDNENSMIRIGEELLVTTEEPPITVRRTEQEYIEEYYDAEIQYVDNDDWYTTDQVTLQQPSCGRRNIVAQISYENDKEVSREIIKEEVLLDAVPKIVERGTKIPPTYIKPISGGRLSSNFGPRKAPKKGASTNHKGIDWSCPVGTAVYASCGGVVTKAGWGSGYGYCVYIKHPDGKETRYGHCSKVLVSAGQTVKQGQKIALSGNTGVSTGPHLHFEIRIGGSAVNPLKYLN